MSPKTTPDSNLIPLGGALRGFAARHKWEKETLFDYIAEKLEINQEDIRDLAKDRDRRAIWEISELLSIAVAIHRMPLSGLNARIEFNNVFDDIRDYVAWDKVELAEYMVHQVIALDLDGLTEGTTLHPRMEELTNLAFAIVAHEGSDACDKAEQSRNFTKMLRARNAGSSKPQEAA